MSRTIDQKVVEMQFDNRQFERNVQTTMSTLDKLKEKLNMTGASKGLDNVSSAARKIDMSVLSGAVETVHAKFSALEVMGVTALANITNSAVNAGKRIVSALTVDPIKTGFQEYETQINAVQTILANTSHAGTDLNDVNAALDDLNEYADRTIYNFTQMTRNIGTFTAAGLGLEESASAIKGIANLAAVSGSTSQQASNAMYQLSQALANGTVNLQDWNSVVNAGMGGKVFQDALVRTASAMKGVTEETFRAQNITGSFRESISSRSGPSWLTAEVLSKTLQQFTGDMTDAELATMGFTEAQIQSIQQMAVTANDAATKVKTFTQLWDTLKESAQSGWTQTWELIVGDFDEAKSMLTEISNAVGKILGDSAESRNNLLSGALNNNWEKMLEVLDKGGISNGFFDENLRGVLAKHGHDVDAVIEKHGSLAEAFRNGSLSSDLLREAVKEVSSSLIDLTSVKAGLKLGDAGDEVKKIQEALDGLDFDIGSEGINGQFNKTTEGALKAFQEMKGLKVTGIVDDETLKALEEANTAAAGLDQKVEHLIGSLGELGGREKLIQSFRNVFEGLGNIIKPIIESFREFFPKTTVAQLTTVIDGFQRLSEQFKTFTEEHSDKIKTTFRGLFSVLDIVRDAFVSVFKSITPLFGTVGDLGSNILNATASIGKWLTSMHKSIEQTDIFGKAAEKVSGFLNNIIIGIKDFGTTIRESFHSSGVESFIAFFQKLWDIIRQIGSKVGEMFAPIGEGLARAFGDANLFDILNSGLLGGIFIALQSFTGGFSKLIDKFKGLIDDLNDGDGFLGNIKGAFEDLRGCFESYQRNLNAETLMKIAKAIGILAASIFVLSTIDAESLDRSVGYLSVVFTELLGSLFLFTKMDASGLKGVTKACGIMTTMSISVLILSGALKVLASIDPKSLINGLIAIGALMTEIALFVTAADFNGKKMMNSALSLVVMGYAMRIMAKAVADFGSMSWEEIGKGLTAMVGALAAVVLALKFMPKDWAASFDGIGSAMSSSKLVSAGATVIAFAVAMKILASAIKDFSALSWEEISKGLTVMVGALASFVIAIKLLPKNELGNLSSGMFGFGASMIAMAAAMLILTKVIDKIGDMSWGDIAKGLTVIGGSLLGFSLALRAMNGAERGGLALLIAAGALAVIAPVLKVLGEMSWTAIVKGLTSLAGAFVVIGVAGAVLAPLIPTILGLAGAFALVGVSVAAIGAGVALFSVGLTALAAAGTAGAAAIVAALTVIVVGILDLIPTIVGKLGELILAVCNVLAECAPEIAVTVLTVVSEILAALATYTPQIIDSLMGFLIGLLDGLAEHLPTLITSAMNLIGSFFQGVVDALNGMDVTTLFKGLIGIGLMTGLMAALSAVVGLIPGAMIGVLGMGAVIAELALVLAAIGAFAQIPGLHWLIGEGGELLQAIGTAIGNFVGGIAGGFLEGMTSSLPQIGTDLSDFMTNVTPFIEGAKSIDASMMEGVKALAETILVLTAADILSGITSWITGGSSLTDFAEQLVPFGEAMKAYSDKVIGIDPMAVVASATAGKALAELANNLPNSGGIVSWFTGENDISEFANQLVPFGEALKKYSDAVIGIDSAAVTASVTAGQALTALANSLPNNGGLASIFSGDNDISSFGTSLVSFGGSMKSYSDKVVGLDLAAVMASVSAAYRVVGLIRSIANLNTNGVNSFVTALSTLGRSSVESFITAFNVAASRLPSVGSNLVESLVKGFESKMIIIKRFTTSLMTEMIQTINGKVTAFDAAGVAVMVKFASGITSQKANITKAITSSLQGATDGIRSYYGSFYNAGSHLVDGFASGISSNTYKAAAKAKAMAEAATRAAKEALDEHSPSRVFYKIGNFAGLGFINALADSAKKTGESGANLAKSAIIGLDGYSKKLGDSARNLGESAVDAMTNPLSTVLDILNGDVDVQPGIAPVIDLTNIKAGAKAINSMLSKSQAMNIEAGINTKHNNVEEFANLVLSGIKDAMVASKDTPVEDRIYHLNVPLTIDGREVAKATASYTESELNRLQLHTNRKLGYL